MPTRMKSPTLVTLLVTLLAALAMILALPPAAPEAKEASSRVSLTADQVEVDDGDTILIRWPERAPEVVRILGIDTPEVFHPEHDLPMAQPFGDVATGFLRGALAVSDGIELLRSGETDPYGRTLGYVYLNGRNYSVLVLEAGLAIENVRHYGDNGLPEQAAEILAASKTAGPVPFEAPFRFRSRMRKLAAHLKKIGRYPATHPEAAKTDDTADGKKTEEKKIPNKQGGEPTPGSKAPEEPEAPGKR